MQLAQCSLTFVCRLKTSRRTGASCGTVWDCFDVPSMVKFSGKDIYASWCSCPSQALFTSTRGLSVLKCKIQRETMGKRIWVSDFFGYQGKTGAVFRWFFHFDIACTSQFFIAGAHRNHFSCVARAHGWWRSWGGAFLRIPTSIGVWTIPSK